MFLKSSFISGLYATEASNCEDYLWGDMENMTLKTEDVFNVWIICMLFAGNWLLMSTIGFITAK